MDLKGVTRIVHNGTEIKGLWFGNSFVWPDSWTDLWDEGGRVYWENVWADRWTPL